MLDVITHNKLLSFLSEFTNIMRHTKITMLILVISAFINLYFYFQLDTMKHDLEAEREKTELIKTLYSDNCRSNLDIMLSAIERTCSAYEPVAIR